MELRAATPADEDEVLDLLSASLGWARDRRHAEFFAWKHRENPFGPSLAWVAIEGARIVGFRTFLRWELVGPGGTVEAVRAVDTATHPDHRGKGIFSRLTTRSLQHLQDEGVSVVFNTPNARSGAGYLKMGWQAAGRLPVGMRPGSLPGLLRSVRARGPAGKWSSPTTAGVPVAEVLDHAEVEGLLASQPVLPGLATHRHRAYLSWRYGFEPLGYRALALDGTPGAGLAIFRVRRRGPATEATICEVLAPGGDSRRRLALMGAVAAEAGADHVLVRFRPGRVRAGFVPLPGQGPTLLWRPLGDASVPPPASWHLELGDLELF